MRRQRRLRDLLSLVFCGLCAFGAYSSALGGAGSSVGGGFLGNNPKRLIQQARDIILFGLDIQVGGEFTPDRKKLIRQILTDDPSHPGIFYYENRRIPDNNGNERMFFYSTKSPETGGPVIYVLEPFFLAYGGAEPEMDGDVVPGVARRLLHEISHLWEYDEEQAKAFSRTFVIVSPPSKGRLFEIHYSKPIGNNLEKSCVLTVFDRAKDTRLKPGFTPYLLTLEKGMNQIEPNANDPQDISALFNEPTQHLDGWAQIITLIQAATREARILLPSSNERKGVEHFSVAFYDSSALTDVKSYPKPSRRVDFPMEQLTHLKNAKMLSDVMRTLCR